MKHVYGFNDFINEYKRFEVFDEALVFGDWSDFVNSLSNAMETGFTTQDELLDLMKMDKSFYNKVKEHMIDNWVDSVSKSMLHGISGVDLEIPEKGDIIFKDPKAQTRFLIVAGPGHTSRNMLGSSNTTRGLYAWGLPSLLDIDSGKSIASITNANLTLKPDKQDILNNILQNVWIYVFFNDYLVKSQKIKLPKILYRGIRIQNVFSIPEVKALLSEIKREDGVDFSHEKYIKARMDVVLDYIQEKGISAISEGNYLSFTSTKSVAEYFSNNEGIVIAVDPQKVRVVTSPLTDTQLAEPNYFNGKKEQEYIVMVPDDYKIAASDITITSEDYLIGSNSPLAVIKFGHDDKKANYDLVVDGTTYNIDAAYSWSSNTTGSVYYTVRKDDHVVSRSETANTTKKKLGFSPVPSAKNLDSITNFEITKKKSW